MQLDAQDFLALCKQAHLLCSFDIEATGLNGDYNSILCVSIKPWLEDPKLFYCRRPGDDHTLVAKVRDEMEKYHCWVSYYGKGYDIPMIRSRLLFHKERDLDKRPHVDMYFALNAHIKSSRRSQGHRISWLGVPEKKMTLSAEEWNKVLADPRKNLPTMGKRCGSDTKGLEGLFRRTGHLIKEVTR